MIAGTFSITAKSIVDLGAVLLGYTVYDLKVSRLYTSTDPYFSWKAS